MIGFHWNGWTQHREGEFTCVDPSLVAMECEYLEVVYGLVRALKPKLILETGSGISTQVLLAARGEGHVISVDTRPVLTPEEGLTIIEGSATDFLRAYKGEPFDFALLDSSEESKVAELEWLLGFPRLAEGGVVALHDTGEKHAHLGWYREQVARVCRMSRADMVTLYKNRGLTLIQG